MASPPPANSPNYCPRSLCGCIPCTGRRRWNWRHKKSACEKWCPRPTAKVWFPPFSRRSPPSHPPQSLPYQTPSQRSFPRPTSQPCPRSPIPILRRHRPRTNPKRPRSPAPMTSQKVLPRPDRETGRVPHVSHLRRGGSNFPKKRSTLRRNFKDHAATNAPALQPAALHGRSVNIPGRIQEEIGEWHASVPAARERVQHRLVALRIELIDGSAVEVPAKRSRAVQIAGRVAHQVIPRAAAVIVASKAVQDGFIAGGVQLVDRAAESEGAAASGRSVEIVAVIGNQTSGGLVSVTCAGGEIVNHSFVPRGIQLEHHPAAEAQGTHSAAAGKRGAVKIRAHFGHTPVGNAAIGSSGEFVQSGFVAGRVDLEDDAATITAGRAVQASPGRDAVDVARGVARDSSILRRLAVSAADLAKAVNHTLIAGRVDLENGRRARRSTTRRGAIEISRRVADHSGHWICAVRNSGEGVHEALCAGGRDLEHRPQRAVDPSLKNCAVQVPLRIADQPAKRYIFVVGLAERMKNF